MHNTSVTLQLAHSVGECILQCGGSDALFPNVFGEGLFKHEKLTACNMPSH